MYKFQCHRQTTLTCVIFTHPHCMFRFLTWHNAELKIKCWDSYEETIYFTPPFWGHYWCLFVAHIHRRVLLYFTAGTLRGRWRHCSWKLNHSRSSITCCFGRCSVRRQTLTHCYWSCIHLRTVSRRGCMYWWSSTEHSVSCCIVSLGSLMR